MLASAVVTLTIEIDHGSSYGSGCSIDQMYEQAARETVSKVEQILLDKHCRLKAPIKVNHVLVQVREDKDR